jgi:hypothetical protein
LDRSAAAVSASLLALAALAAALRMGGAPFDRAPAAPASHPVASTAPVERRVNAPFLSPPDPDPLLFPWERSAIFWFGKAEYNVDDWQTPGRNYVDVRVAYTPDALWVRVQVIDYFLWYNVNPQPSDDLAQYDGVGLYLDTAHDGAGVPQPDDYGFFSGWRHWPTTDAPRYKREARGTGSGWDAGWSGIFTDTAGAQWSSGSAGPNRDDDGIDYGWANGFVIPWSTLGLSGPPADGAVWGLGVIVYDRDEPPPAAMMEAQIWPETFDTGSPSTWADLAFRPPPYDPPDAVPLGSAIVRRGLGDSVVEDAWMGGGGWCSSGHEGGTEINHGGSADLYVGTETAPTHFPCYNKSFLRFYLPDIPPGQVILSATLTLHHWGNAGAPGLAPPSFVYLYTIADDWDEMVIHWNNAPLAKENVAATWIYPLTSFAGWPGVPYTWDATQAVAQAYSAGEPVNLAIYSPDSIQHTSKYLSASEAEDWNAEARPTLEIVWGVEVATLAKEVAPASVSQGQTVTYTLGVVGSGNALTVTDSLPAGVSAPGPIAATAGVASYDVGQHRVEWSGAPSAGEQVTITFPVTASVAGPIALHNTAVLNETGGLTGTDGAVVIVDGRRVYLPLVRSGGG